MAGNDRRLGYRWVFLERAFDFKWADAVAGANNHIVGTAHKPEVAILISFKLQAMPGQTDKQRVSFRKRLHQLLQMRLYVDPRISERMFPRARARGHTKLALLHTPEEPRPRRPSEGLAMPKVNCNR